MNQEIPMQSGTAVTTTDWREAWRHLASRAGRLTDDSLLAMLARIAMAATFFLSGRTKVSGFLTITDGTRALFRDEYRVPLLSPETAAHLATWAEHLFPVLLLLGLGTRLSALALLGMTLVIQVFVYPDAWPTHLTWAVALLYLVGRGGGAWSVDRLLRVA
jgi:putative oxidoreductase